MSVIKYMIRGYAPIFSNVHFKRLLVVTPIPPIVAYNTYQLLELHYFYCLSTLVLIVRFVTSCDALGWRARAFVLCYTSIRPR